MDIYMDDSLAINAKSAELALGLISGVLLMARDSTEVDTLLRH